MKHSTWMHERGFSWGGVYGIPKFITIGTAAARITRWDMISQAASVQLRHVSSQNEIYASIYASIYCGSLSSAMRHSRYPKLVGSGTIKRSLSHSLCQLENRMSVLRWVIEHARRYRREKANDEKILGL